MITSAPLADRIRRNGPSLTVKEHLDPHYMAAIDGVIAQAELLRDLGYFQESYVALRLAAKLLLRDSIRETKKVRKRRCFRISTMSKSSRSQDRISRAMFRALEDFEKGDIGNSQDLLASFVVVRMLRKEIGGVR